MQPGCGMRSLVCAVRCDCIYPIIPAWLSQSIATGHCGALVLNSHDVMTWRGTVVALWRGMLASVDWCRSAQKKSPDLFSGLGGSVGCPVGFSLLGNPGKRSDIVLPV